MLKISLDKLESFHILAKDAESGNIANAYLIASHDRALIELMAREFAFRILFGAERDTISGSAMREKPYADGEMREIVYKGRYADAIVYPAITADGSRKKSLYVADIDEIVQLSGKRPSKGARKVFILDYAETLNPASQNKLLKTLEEPPAGTTFILTAASLAPVLPTVLSRCRKVEPVPFTKAELYDILNESGQACDEPELVIAAALGTLDGLTRALDDRNYMGSFKTAELLVRSLKSSKDALINAARLIAQKDSLPDVLGFTEVIYRDIAVFKTAGGGYCEFDEHRIAGLAGEISAEAALEILPEIRHAKERLIRNGNVTATVDSLVFKIAELRAVFK